MNIKMFLSCLIVLALVFSFYKNETVLAQSEESMEIDETSTDKIFGKTADDSFAIKD